MKTSGDDFRLTTKVERRLIVALVLFLLFPILCVSRCYWEAKTMYFPSAEVKKRYQRMANDSLPGFEPVAPLRFVNSANAVWVQRMQFDVGNSFAYRYSFLLQVILPMCVVYAVMMAVLNRKEMLKAIEPYNPTLYTRKQHENKGDCAKRLGEGGR